MDPAARGSVQGSALAFGSYSLERKEKGGPCGQSFYVRFARKLGLHQICLSVGRDHLGYQGGVLRILGIHWSYISLGAADAIYQTAVRFSQYCRADQSVAEFIAEFD